MKLLIIEDERSLADSLEALLQTKGFETQAVYDGKNGLAYAELDIYDLVILDVTLPELSGYDMRDTDSDAYSQIRTGRPHRGSECRR